MTDRISDWDSAQVQIHQPHQGLGQGLVDFGRELHGSTAGKAQFALPVVEPQPPLFERALWVRAIGHVHELKRGDGRRLYPQPLVHRGFGCICWQVKPLDFRKMPLWCGKQKQDFVQRRHGQDGEGGAEKCVEFSRTTSRGTWRDAIAQKGLRNVQHMRF